MSNIIKLYGSKKQWYLNRKNKLSSLFTETFKEEPTTFFSSSGRIEVLGNHTDHNNGLVLVSAIDLDTFAAVKKRTDNRVVLKSASFPINDIDITDLNIKDDEIGKSNSLIRGILYKYKELGFKIGGFSAVTESSIFKGAGLSTSAAFEMLICIILNTLYNDNKVSRIQMAQIGQYAENTYFKKPCGLLDEMGISLGGFNFVDFGDNSEPKIENFSLALDDYRIVLTNTVDSSGPNSLAWYDSDGVELPNEVQIYGTRIWGSALNGFDIATQKQQFPLMALAPQFVNTRQDYWLQDVSSGSVSSTFAGVSGDGTAGGYGASVSLGVRPSVTLSYI